jgi:hypothetical protein
MSSGFKTTLKRFVPPIVIDSIGFARAAGRFLHAMPQLRQNRSMKARYLGESVYILGNGPSLRDFDLKSIGSVPVITMNHFELHPNKDSVSIVAHCIGEPYRGDTWEDPMPMIEGVRAKSYWVNADAIPYFSGRNVPNLHFYLPGVRQTALLMQGDNLAAVALGFQSTAQMAIVLALYLGFRKIYLLGLDHDWLVTRGYSPHFYEEPDHMAKADLSRFTYTEMIRISLDLFETYQKIAKIAAKRGARIVNLSTSSYLDVFPTYDKP